ncbi:MAG TPA: hypothetical protein VFZ75_08025 [Actinomycetota bacterium]|nr:hypothetical protein [Actinomycetota bacterium]
MSDYSALARRASTSISGVRGCLMLSRDGLVLGAEPEDLESDLRSDWVRFASLGDPQRSYVEFPDRIWAFVRRGGYGAFAVADADVRPGLLMDVLDQALMASEQDRTRERDTMRVPDAPTRKARKHRTKMHKPERPAAPEPVIAPPEPPPLAIAEVAPSETVELAVDRPPAPDPAPPPDPGEAEPPAAPPRDDESEVDRILLAKEFAGLLQVSREDDEANG